MVDTVPDLAAHRQGSIRIGADTALALSDGLRMPGRLSKVMSLAVEGSIVMVMRLAVADWLGGHTVLVARCQRYLITPTHGRPTPTHEQAGSHRQYDLPTA